MPRSRTLEVLVLVATASAGCGNEPSSPPSPPPAPSAVSSGATSASSATQEGAAGARAVVEAWFAAAAVPDEGAMLALGTPEWREKEKAWKKGFTRNIADGAIRPTSHETREPAVEGDVANVSARAVFAVRGGKDDREGLSFTLKRADGRWWITDLR